MSVDVNKKDIIWSYIGNILKYGISFFTLPLVLRSLEKEQLAIWYIFGTIGGLMMLLDFGISPTIMRNISYIWGGAKELKQTGINSEQFNNEPNYRLLYEVIKESKKIYGLLSIIALTLLLTIGTYYIDSISVNLENSKVIIVAWVIYSIACALNFYYSYITILLMGTGSIKESEIAIAIANLCYLFALAIGLIYFHLGILALSICYLLTPLISRNLSKRFFFTSKIKREFLNIEKDRCNTTIQESDMFKIIWSNSYKLGIVTVGAYLITQSNTIICSKFIDLKTTGQYGLSMQFFNLIATFSSIVFRSYLPVFNEARLRKDESRLKRYFSIAVLVGWISYIFVGLAFLVFGSMVIKLIGSKTQLLDIKYLLFMFIYLFLEFNHGQIFSTFITTKNEIPFVKPALISGACIVILSIVFVKKFNMGIFGLMLSQFLVQIAYNNWKWPYVVLKEMNMSLRELFVTGYRNTIIKLKNIIRWN